MVQLCLGHLLDQAVAIDDLDVEVLILSALVKLVVGGIHSPHKLVLFHDALDESLTGEGLLL